MRKKTKLRFLVAGSALLILARLSGDPGFSQQDPQVCDYNYENCAANCWWFDDDCYMNCSVARAECLSGQNCFVGAGGYIYCMDRQG